MKDPSASHVLALTLPKGFFGPEVPSYVNLAGQVAQASGDTYLWTLDNIPDQPQDGRFLDQQSLRVCFAVVDEKQYQQVVQAGKWVFEPNEA